MAMQNNQGDEPSDDLSSERGIEGGFDEARAWMSERGIEEIECMVPDQAGVARGKIMPASKFLAGRVMNLPQSIFIQTISGDYPETDELGTYNPADSDLNFVPDFSTLTIVPWENEPTAQIIHDAFHRNGQPVEEAPRNVLRRVVALYEARGWKPVIAPEIEFYLVKPNKDPDYPLEPPIGRSGRPEAGRKSFSISAVNEFDPLVDLIYDYAEAQGMEIDTLIHEEGAAQMEINLRHGDPITLADHVFLFKRSIREAALANDVYATFMAKPIAREPGSALHIHQSVVDMETGNNIFSNADGSESAAFRAFLGGQQKYLPPALSLMAPYVNSYRRLMRSIGAPSNISWGYDNRTVGIRIPNSAPVARRIENRIPSSDANPYLAIAASLAAGYLGIVEKLEPSPPAEGYVERQWKDLPSGLLEAVAAFKECTPLHDVLGSAFVETYSAVKIEEFETFMQVISPWEREYLLLNV